MTGWTAKPQRHGRFFLGSLAIMSLVKAVFRRLANRLLCLEANNSNDEWESW